MRRSSVSYQKLGLSVNSWAKVCLNTSTVVARKKAKKIASGETFLPPPNPGQQEKAFNSKADIVVFGGSAGGGKSFCDLLDAGRPEFINTPGFTSVTFRRNTNSIRGAGGIWPTSQDLYPSIGGVPNKTSLEWKFPKGASIKYAHLQYEETKFLWKSNQICRLSFEEGSEFTEGQWWYMFSRNRSTCGVKPKCFVTCNPTDAEHWLFKLIFWWLMPDTQTDGYIPDPSKDGMIRWFCRIDSKLHWANSAQELLDEYGQLYADANRGAQLIPKSLTFIHAKVTDNPALMKSDPSYMSNLGMLHPMETLKLLHGVWGVSAKAGDYYDRTWFGVPIEPEQLDLVNPVICSFWDFAASDNSKKHAYFTARVKVAKGYSHTFGRVIYVILDCLAVKKKAGEVESFLIHTALMDGVHVHQVWEMEGGSAGAHLEPVFKRELQAQMPGVICLGVRPLGNKAERSIVPASAAHRGEVKYIRGEWNSLYFRCLEGFDTSPKPEINDVFDANNGGILYLTNKEVWEPAKTGQVKHAYGFHTSYWSDELEIESEEQGDEFIID